jgi:hypothetical protein
MNFVCCNGTELPVTAPMETTAAAVKTSASMEASAKARLPARGKTSGNSSVIKAAERARMSTRLGV